MPQPPGIISNPTSTEEVSVAGNGNEGQPNEQSATQTSTQRSDALLPVQQLPSTITKEPVTMHGNANLSSLSSTRRYTTRIRTKPKRLIAEV